MNNLKIKFIQIIYTVWGYFLFLSFSMILAAILPVVFIFSLPFDRKRNTMVRLIKVFFRIVFFLNFFQRNRFDFNNLAKPVKGEKRIYIINHSSVFDTVTFYSLPGLVRTIMKESYLKIPFVGFISYMSGNIILKNAKCADDTVYNKALQTLESGLPIVIFPEGTKSRDGNIGKFHKGAFKIAKETKADIIPVVFDNWYVIKPGSLWIRDFKIFIKTLAPLKYDEYQNMKSTEISDLVRRRIIKGLLQIRNNRRNSEKNYYRNDPHFISLDQAMEKEISSAAVY